VIRYIHQNPQEAGLVKNIADYQWSSIGDDIQNKGSLLILILYCKCLKPPTKKDAVNRFIKFCTMENEDRCLDMENQRRLSDPEAMDLIKAVCQVKTPLDLAAADKAKRNEYLKQLKEEYNLSIRQIERLTGISRGIIFNA